MGHASKLFDSKAEQKRFDDFFRSLNGILAGELIRRQAMVRV
jgi:hypothetical protein